MARFGIGFMKVFKSTLNNGLRVIIIPMPSVLSATATVWAGVGSSHEPRSKAGIAHFFEHIVFKGSAKRPSAKAISEAVDNFGGEQNAFTGKEMTGFYIKAPAERLGDAVDILSDMVLNPLIPVAEVKREKGVIKAELDMYRDTPVRHIFDIYEEEVFAGTPLQYDVIGSKKTIDKITREDFLDYKNKFYQPQNMLVTVAGGVDVEQVKKLVARHWKLDVKNKTSKNQKSNAYGLTSKYPRVRVEFKKTDQAHMILGFRGIGIKDKKMRFSEEVLRAILGGGMSSRMFEKVRERRGLAYAVKTANNNYTHTGSFQTYAGVEPQKAFDALKIILAEYKKMTDKKTAKISESELTKAKEYLKGHLALSLEDTSEVGEIFGVEELLLEEIMTPEQMIKAIDKVTIDDVISVAKHHFNAERMAFTVIGPYKNSDRKVFEKLVNTY